MHFFRIFFLTIVCGISDRYGLAAILVFRQKDTFVVRSRQKDAPFFSYMLPYLVRLE